MLWTKSAVILVVLTVLVALTRPMEVGAVDVFCTPIGFQPPGINTALGCVPVQTKDFVVWLLPYLFGIAGGIAFLKMVLGFISIATSSGDAKAVAGAQEEITSAIIGLVVVIFAMFILKLVAADILKIPGI